MSSFELADISRSDISQSTIEINGSKELKEPLDMEKHHSSEDILPVELSKYNPPFVLIPMLEWIHELKQNYINDIIAGITVASILIPQSLAYLLFIIQ